MIDTTFKNPTLKEIREVALDHKIQPNHNVLTEIRNHRCSWYCLIRNSDASLVDDTVGDNGQFSLMDGRHSLSCIRGTNFFQL